MNQSKRQTLIVMMLALVAVLAILTTGFQHTGAQDSDCVPDNLDTQLWQTDFCKHSVDFDEIVDVIIPRDRVGIVAIDNPVMENVADASAWLVDQSPVIAVEVDGEARAYPLAILMFHEIANDEINGVPIAVTFCPLCNSSIVFDRRVEGQTLTFRVSGKLRNSDLIMWDLETETWWQQLTGEGIVGDYTETLLEIIPSRVVGFGQFSERYPEGMVMSRDTGFNRSYGINPYEEYDVGLPINGFFNHDRLDDRIPATQRVLAGIIGGQPIAFPFNNLRQEIVINETVGGVDVVAFWQPGVASALEQTRIDQSRDIGTAGLFNRELDGQTLTFSWQDDVLVDDQTGSEWNLFGQAVAGELEGSQLEQLIAAPHFWFAWVAFQPETAVYGE